MQLFILSASSRFMAESALRAGFGCCAVDWFNDWDLTRLAQSVSGGRLIVRKISDFADWEEVSEYFETAAPDGNAATDSDCGIRKNSPSSVDARGTLATSTTNRRFDSQRMNPLARSLEKTSAMIGGGCENDLEVVKQIERRFELLGPTSESLARLNDTQSIPKISGLVESAGGQFPTTQITAPATPIDFQSTESWLKKNWCSAGGKHVTEIDFANASSAATGLDVSLSGEVEMGAEIDAGIVYQQRLRGDLLSAVFLGGKEDCEILCVTQQLVGRTVLGAARFSYCGSVGPVSLASSQQATMHRIGVAISTHFEIRGLFGIDFIVNQNGVWVVDINPRMPASAEVYELSHRLQDGGERYSIVAEHVAVCTGGDREKLSPSALKPNNPKIGKAILFCRSPSGILIDDKVLQRLVGWHRPLSAAWIADIPHAGTKIELEQPILSLFVVGDDERAVKQKLFEFARLLSELVGDVDSLVG